MFVVIAVLEIDVGRESYEATSMFKQRTQVKRELIRIRGKAKFAMPPSRNLDRRPFFYQKAPAQPWGPPSHAGVSYGHPFTYSPRTRRRRHLSQRGFYQSQRQSHVTQAPIEQPLSDQGPTPSAVQDGPKPDRASWTGELSMQFPHSN